jgi:hypothetical protein
MFTYGSCIFFLFPGYDVSTVFAALHVAQSLRNNTEILYYQCGSTVRKNKSTTAHLTQTLGALLNVTCKPKNQPGKQGAGGGGGTRKKQPQRDL